MLGLGVSNRPLVRLLLEFGCDVTGCDRTARENLEEEVLELERMGCSLRVGDGYLDGLEADLVFRTPGMHPENPALVALRENGAYYAQICPFTDVPQWAKSSIGFLYDKKLAAGQSSTKFGTSNVTKRDYAVMMMRVLGIKHSYENALAIAVSHGILTEEQASGNPVALRGDIVNMTYNTLQLLEAQEEHIAVSE